MVRAWMGEVAFLYPRALGGLGACPHRRLAAVFGGVDQPPASLWRARRGRFFGSNRPPCIYLLVVKERCRAKKPSLSAGKHYSKKD